MKRAAPDQTALILFAKRPHIGHGKQRLAEEIGVDKALEVANVLLEITLDTLTEWPDTLVISPSEQSDSVWACGLLDRVLISIPQKHGTLGARLEQIDREVRMLAYRHLIFIGTDAPLLSCTELNKVKASLEQYDQVFIPASDGGVVLMASRVPWSGLEQVPWSTEKVFMTLKSLAIQQGLSVQILKGQTDLDDMESFNKLKPQLIKHNKQMHKPLLKQLINLLSKHE